MRSIIIPVYNEAESLTQLHAELAVVFPLDEREPAATEFVWVDDGSTDSSWAVLRALAEQDPRVIGVRLRRNFGKATAYAAGFRTARGEVLATLDADLQDDPVELPKMFAKLQEYDCVIGWKVNRHDPRVKVWSSRLFNAALGSLSGVRLHDQNCGIRVLRREVVDALPLRGDLYRMIPALAAMQGFRVAEMPVHHRTRQFGASKYGRTGLRRMFRGLFDLGTVALLFRFRNRPAHFFGAVGGVLLLLGMVINLSLAMLWFSGEQIGGRPLLLLGVLLMVLGVQVVTTGFLADLLILGRERETPLPIAEVLQKQL
ncbi:glycosyltransferase family 2 protein [Candidatus Uhrbacteria bacterium]|nr:glycosyltransferase family 2 protein [Candidatus Uhrbacteria bacterium]